jgi:hypothetical protein
MAVRGQETWALEKLEFQGVGPRARNVSILALSTVYVGAGAIEGFSSADQGRPCGGTLHRHGLLPRADQGTRDPLSTDWNTRPERMSTTARPEDRRSKIVAAKLGPATTFERVPA